MDLVWLLKRGCNKQGVFFKNEEQKESLFYFLNYLRFTRAGTGSTQRTAYLHSPAWTYTQPQPTLQL